MPLFSVLIPSYNRPEFVGAAVRSILRSGFDDFEIVVSDDKSPRQAEIEKVLEPCLADPRVRLHLQAVNLREAANREFLLQAAHGEWLIILGDDDLLLENTLGVLAKAIRERPGADIYAFGYSIIDERDAVSYSRRAPKPLRISVANPALAREMVVSDAFPFWFYHPATFCAHRRVRERIRPNPDVGIGDDVMFLIDYINTGGELDVIPEVLMHYRKMGAPRAGLQPNQSAGDMPNLVTRAKIMQALIGRMDLHPVLAEFVATRGFRERLLYDSVVWTGRPLSTVLPQLGLRPEFERELTAYMNGRNRLLHRQRLLLRRVGVFCRLFGLAGLGEVAKVQLQRITTRAA